MSDPTPRRGRGPTFVPLEGYREYPPEEMERRAAEFRRQMEGRRTVREFSDRPVPPGIVEDCLAAAARAPSGANRQPWRFVAVRDPELKRRIREAAEAEERAFYAERAPREWLEALAALGTDEEKPFLEQAPWLIAIFAESYEVGPGGEKVKNYYVQESVGIATGILVTALHHAGLVSLTHTPSPMGFLNDLLDRPPNERPFLLLVTGYPAEGARVPDIAHKPLSEIVTWR